MQVDSRWPRWVAFVGRPGRRKGVVQALRVLFRLGRLAALFIDSRGHVLAAVTARQRPTPPADQIPPFTVVQPTPGQRALPLPLARLVPLPLESPPVARLQAAVLDAVASCQPVVQLEGAPAAPPPDALLQVAQVIVGAQLWWTQAGRRQPAGGLTGRLPAEGCPEGDTARANVEE